MYTIYDTPVAAIAANAQAAFDAGCNMTTTSELYSRHQHPTDGRSALADGTGPVTIEQMIAEGWFPEEDVEEGVI